MKVLFAQEKERKNLGKLGHTFSPIINELWIKTWRNEQKSYKKVKIQYLAENRKL